MSTTPSQPQMSWGPIRDQVAEDAKTLNASELADKYGVNRWTMRRALARLGITPVPGGVRWAEKLPEIREQAKTKTVKQLAAQTSKATEEIAAEIAGVQTITSEAVSTIAGISATITRINGVSSSIASAVEEQAAVTQDMSGNMQTAAEKVVQTMMRSVEKRERTWPSESM